MDRTSASCTGRFNFHHLNLPQFDTHLLPAHMITPTLDELHIRADEFSKEFTTAAYEMGQAQNFIRELCTVYGVNYL